MELNITNSRENQSVELPNSFTKTLEFIKIRMEKIKYNQLNFLSSKCQIEYDYTSEIYTFNNFYKNPTYPNQGSCGELEAALFAEIIKNRTTTYKHFGTVLRCYGQDGGKNGKVGFFSHLGANHSFILVSPKQDLVDKNAIYQNVGDNYAFQKMVENYYVVDPSFGRIENLKKSGYIVNGCSRENIKIQKPKNCILKKDEGVPLFLSKNGENLWNLFNGGNEYGLILYKSTKSDPDNPQLYRLSSKKLKDILINEMFGEKPTLANKEMIARMLDNFRKD
jgi:hypothetical protein